MQQINELAVQTITFVLNFRRSFNTVFTLMSYFFLSVWTLNVQNLVATENAGKMELSLCHACLTGLENY